MQESWENVARDPSQLGGPSTNKFADSGMKLFAYFLTTITAKPETPGV